MQLLRILIGPDDEQRRRACPLIAPGMNGHSPRARPKPRASPTLLTDADAAHRGDAMIAFGFLFIMFIIA